jgi:CheY-like chemotaxis protein
MPERRVFRRADVSRPLQFEILSGSDNSPIAQIEGETVNIGCGGISAKIRGQIIPGSACRVRIWDAAESTEPDEVEGEIRWVEPLADGAFVGIAFESRLDAMRQPWPLDEPAELPAMLPQRVLVADDEPEIRELLARFLARLGCEVDTAANGEEALESMRREKPDILLLDLRMPRLDGLGVLEQIRNENLEVGPIWAISGYASDHEAERAMHLGATDFINKPLDLQYLEWSLTMSQMAR